MQAFSQNRLTDRRTDKQTDRQSNFELLRILSMVMIVACHFATHGKFTFDDKIITIPRLWWYFIEMGGNLGVDIFVLISGYYLIMDKRESAKISKILYFWAQTFFYSVSIYCIFLLSGKTRIDVKTLIKTFLPLSSGVWWFASAYFVLYIIHPYINAFLHSIKKELYQKFLLLMVTLWCILPTFRIRYPSSSVTWFVTLYCVAGYVRLYGIPRFSKNMFMLGFIFFSTLRYLSSVAFMILGTLIPYAAKLTLSFYGQQSVLTFLSAVSIVLFFEKKEIAYNKWINIVASGTFGVYLIHDNNLVRPFLWVDIFRNASYQDSLLLIPYSIFVVVIVFTVCILIELLRKELFERRFLNILIPKIVPIIEKFIHQIECYVGEIIGS